LERALAAPGDAKPPERAEMAFEAARCARELGRLKAAASRLDEAEKLGADVTIERATLRLRAGDAAGAAALVEGLSPEPLRPSETWQAIQAVRGLRAAGLDGPRARALEAVGLETCGDFANALLAYRRLARTHPSEAIDMRARACALQLGLRLDVLRTAVGPGADAGAVLASRFDGERVPESMLPAVEHERAGPWLELCDLYRRTGRPDLAYRMARAARSLEPGNVAAYLAVGETALQVGGGPVARLALERAVHLDGGNAAARDALRKLPPG
jgi:hypothetical protein